MSDFTDLLKLLMPAASGPRKPSHTSNRHPAVGFTIGRASEGLRPQPPVDWIVDRLFAAPGLGLVFGEAGSKKTYAMLDLAACVAAGLPWLGRPTRQCPVLFVDEESGPSRLIRRLGEVLRGHALQDPPLFYTSLDHLDLGDPGHMQHITKLVELTGARLIIVDSWAAASPSLETENDAVLVQRVFGDLRPVAQSLNVALVVVHHANRGGGYRGSSVFKGAVDTLLLVESRQESHHIDFSFEKARDVEAFRFAAEAHFDDEAFHLSPASPQARLPGLGLAETFVLRFLAVQGPSPSSAVEAAAASAQACRPSAARFALYDLASRGLVWRSNAGGRGVSALYDLTDSGRSQVPT